MPVTGQHTNSEGEVISIDPAGGEFVGQYLLVIHDDPPPLGTGTRAPTLLDEGTVAWLLAHLQPVDGDR